MMLPSFSGLLFTCLLLPGMAQDQEEAPAPPSATSSCPQGFSFYGSHCYGLLGPGETWNTAEVLHALQSCCARAIPQATWGPCSMRQSSFVTTMIKEQDIGQNPVWIGLYNPNKNCRWKWSSNALYLYQDWAQGSPGSTSQNYCVSLTPQSEFQSWKDEPCQRRYLYLCKFKA